MDIIVTGALIRSFSGLGLVDTMSAKKKQVMVLAFAVILSLGYTVTHGTITLAGAFDALISGLTAGFTAIGIYHSTQPSENLG